MLQKIERIQTTAHLTKEETDLEKKNRLLSREIAEECIVLLKNDGSLPLKGKDIALYGTGAINTVKGGSGSSEVNNRYDISIYEGLKNEGFEIINEEQLLKYKKDSELYKKEYELRKTRKAGLFNFEAINMANIKQREGVLEYPLLKEDELISCDNAIYVISRKQGEGADRKLSKGDYYLTDNEIDNIHLLSRFHEHLILITNMGSPVDLSPLDDINLASIIHMGLLGEEGGTALARILSGKTSPSAHLATTWPLRYEDVPDYKEYVGKDNLDYREGIYVGYRYYDTFKVQPRFIFGDGLSYTTFDIKSKVRDGLTVDIDVLNTGSYKGKCVVQVYASLPTTNLDQPESILVGFIKTKELQPNESEYLSLDVPYEYLASFDSRLGVKVLERGTYGIYAGETLRDKKLIAGFRLDEDIILSKHQPICPLNKELDVLKAPSREMDVPEDLLIEVHIKPSIYIINRNEYYEEAKKIVDKLSLKELTYLLVGTGVIDMVIPRPHDIIVPGVAGYSTNKIKGIPSLIFSDGPSGLRLLRTSLVKKNTNKIKIVEPGLEMLKYIPKIVKMFGYAKEGKGTVLYTNATAFPTASALAQSFNIDLLSKMWDAISEEMEEYGVNIFLGPGINIQKNPLCGRNFEYYSEDPLLSGKMGSAIVKGVSLHKGCYATIKHFVANNQEIDRQYMSANMDERTLRDIYLRGFEIAAKEGKAQMLMSSYNMVNGVYVAVSKDLLTTVLKDEWHYEGMVMTDWDTSHKNKEAYKSIANGIDIMMPGSYRQRRKLYRALKSGKLDKKVARERAIRVVSFALSSKLA